jgi:hypothetical protein
MNRFTSLWPVPGTPGLHGPSADQAEVVRRLPAAVADSPLHWWSPGDPVAERGARLLLGIAPYSWYDLRLLDLVDEALSTWRGPEAPPRVDVFSTLDCRTQDDFHHYVPGVAPVYQTPVLGRWQDGVQVSKATGALARDEAARLFGKSERDVIEWVDAMHRPSTVR